MKFVLLFIFIQCCTCFAQPSFIEIRSNFAVGEHIFDLAYQKKFSSNWSYELSIGTGNYGKRTYDGISKDIFGHTAPLLTESYYSIGINPKTYYTSSHPGAMLGVGFIGQSKSYNGLQASLTIGLSGIFTREQISFDFDSFYGGNSSTDTTFSRDHISLAFFYNACLTYKISKKIYLTGGLNLPFYFMLTNPYDEESSDKTNSLALGFEPKALLGVKFKLK
jgi:hypothetical protein